jgi:G3E family GTPase
MLAAATGERVTAIVPKRGRRSRRGSGNKSIIQTSEHLVRLGQGCSCCTVRGDIRAKVGRLAAENAADHIVIQAAPQSDIVTLAKTFTVADDRGATLSQVAHLQNVVAVVDAREALQSLRSTSARRLVQQIELANVLLLDQTSDMSEPELAQLTTVLEAINPAAQVTRASADDISMSSLTASRPFDLDGAQYRATLATVLDDSWAPSGDVSSLAYRARKPFHPARLHSLITRAWAGIVRAHGVFWVASRPDSVCMLDVAGSNWTTSVGGRWWASVPAEQQPNTPQFRAYRDEIWHPDFADRKQEIAFVGVSMDVDALRTALDACLLTDDELAAPDQWSRLPHPFSWPEAVA